MMHGSSVQIRGFDCQQDLFEQSRTQTLCKKNICKSMLCRKSWVFSGYSGFLLQGKLTWWVRWSTVISSSCCGDPALVAKLNK